MADAQRSAPGSKSEKARVYINGREVGEGGRGRTEEEARRKATLDEMRIERLAEARFADMMSNAGVPVSRMSLEVLYMMPKSFTNIYAEVFTRACGGKDDGGSGARGASQDETAKLGKAKGKSGSGGGGKRFKRHWVIADEKMLDLKERLDKRLRSLARDALLEMEGLSGGREEDRKERTQCATCKMLVSKDWRFCPTCGHNLEDG